MIIYMKSNSSETVCFLCELDMHCCHKGLIFITPHIICYTSMCKTHRLRVEPDCLHGVTTGHLRITSTAQQIPISITQLFHL